MDRLTKRNENGVAILNVKCPEGYKHSTCSMEEGYQCQHQCEGDVIERLTQYEELEDQGLLLRLPHSIGNKVYGIRKYSYCPSGICRKDISCSECRDRSPWEIYEKKFALNDLKEIGKTVFLTREDADEKLKGLSK